MKKRLGIDSKTLPVEVNLQQTSSITPRTKRRLMWCPPVDWPYIHIRRRGRGAEAPAARADIDGRHGVKLLRQVWGTVRECRVGAGRGETTRQTVVAALAVFGTGQTRPRRTQVPGTRGSTRAAASGWQGGKARHGIQSAHVGRRNSDGRLSTSVRRLASNIGGPRPARPATPPKAVGSSFRAAP